MEVITTVSSTGKVIATSTLIYEKRYEYLKQGGEVVFLTGKTIPVNSGDKLQIESWDLDLEEEVCEHCEKYGRDLDHSDRVENKRLRSNSSLIIIKRQFEISTIPIQEILGKRDEKLFEFSARVEKMEDEILSNLICGHREAWSQQCK